MRFMLVRIVLTAAVLVLAAAESYALTSSACTVNSGAYIGSPACSYQGVGVTAVAFTGDGNGLGFIGMTSQCRGEFGPGARMCTSQEILESGTLNFNAYLLCASRDLD